MIQRQGTKWVLILCSVLLLLNTASAQQPFLSARIDRKDILIGEQITYTVKAIFPNTVYRINWLSIPDSVAHFEVVEKMKTDTSISGNMTSLEQKIIFTSFDSGRWTTPELAVNFESLSGDKKLPMTTEALPVNVSYSPADSTNQLRDIKPIIEVTITDYTWYYVAGGALLLLIIIFLLWRYFKRRPKKPAAGPVSKLSPYQEAVEALRQLKQYDLNTREQVVQYHTGLSDIFKRYLGRVQKRELFNKTTGDLLIRLADNNLDATVLSSLASALRTGDAVKFAKYQPAVYESEQSLEQVAAAIQQVEQQAQTDKQ
jgi:hypothetical protein